ncbi:MAG: hypothetical protein WDN44_02655 [Sphingomonas sp.]
MGLVGVLAGNLLFAAPDPPLLRGLPEHYDAASKTLTDRVRARFPAGTPEAGVIAELGAQGFEVSPPSRSAHWRRTGLPCTEIAAIWWSAEQGRVTAIEGLRNAICP